MLLRTPSPSTHLLRHRKGSLAKAYPPSHQYKTPCDTLTYLIFPSEVPEAEIKETPLLPKSYCYTPRDAAKQIDATDTTPKEYSTPNYLETTLRHHTRRNQRCCYTPRDAASRSALQTPHQRNTQHRTTGRQPCHTTQGGTSAAQICTSGRRSTHR